MSQKTSLTLKHPKFDEAVTDLLKELPPPKGERKWKKTKAAKKKPRTKPGSQRQRFTVINLA